MIDHSNCKMAKKGENRKIIPDQVSVKILDPDPECYLGH
jgi:hypothetical protein